MSSAQTMKIFSIINRIKQELEESPRSKFGGTNKRVVEVDRLLDLLEDLKVVIPEDIRRATGNSPPRRRTPLRMQKKTRWKSSSRRIRKRIQSSANRKHRRIASARTRRLSLTTAWARAKSIKKRSPVASGIAAEAEENATAIYNGARKYADEIPRGSTGATSPNIIR